jgi:hypothetical protein
MNLADILEGAGLGNLLGASKYSWRVQKVMGKKSPNYRKSEAIDPKPSFVYDLMDNRSPFIQRKYGPEGESVKPFDYCKAQQRRENLSEEDKLWEAVHKPEYWGLRWGAKGATSGAPDELFPVGNGGKGEHYVNGDGLRFPPVKFVVKDKVYWGLPCCGGKPEGRTRVYDANEEGLRGKTVHKNRERIRRSMLFFRSDKMPNFTHLPEFSDAAAYERGAKYTRNPEKQYRGVVVRKRYNGVELVGTDRVMAKGSKGKRQAVENAEAPIPIDSLEDAPFQASLQGIRSAPEVAPFMRDEPLPALEAEPPRRKIKRRAAETEEEEEARVKAAYDEWFEGLDANEKRAAKTRFRNYSGAPNSGSKYVGERAMSLADAYRKVATTGNQASKITIP